jgi:protein-tyrosine phosphatase
LSHTPEPTGGTDGVTTMESLLFVCTGNVCRSPMAQAVAASLLERRGAVVDVRSAGTMHAGQPPTPRAQWAMRRRGLDVAGHRSRGLEDALDPAPDLILAMCREHARAVVDLRPDLFGRTFTLKDFVRRAGEEGARRRTEDLASFVERLQLGRKPWDLQGSEPADDVADPIGRRRRFYERCAAEIDALVATLVDMAWPVHLTG